jgi:DNA-binding NtrC family response regulator
MTILRTREEPKPRSGQRVRLLTQVLSFDDLLAPPARVVDLGRKLSIGREGGDCDLRLADPWLSTEHLVIETRGDADVLVDRGSRNGTWVNGRRAGEHRLASGDLIEAGHTLFAYRVCDAAAAARVLGGEPKLGPTRTFNPDVALLAEELTRVARSRDPVLIVGETGTGKESAAAMVHAESGRRGPCVVLDCGAVPETLFETTFFGHRRGAFTGASEPRVGEIARAHGGTLVLDEVGNMGAAAQAKLLRVIEDGRVTPLGAAEPMVVDVRWIAATNRELVGDPEFRVDLVARLSGFVARLPPLRERREDLGVLTAAILDAAGVTRVSCSAAAGRELYNSAFGANIRELRARLRSAALLAGDGAIELGHVQRAPAAAAPTTATPEPRSRKPLPPTAAELSAALEQANGNVVHAAASLGTHPRQVYRWLAHYGLDVERFRR